MRSRPATGTLRSPARLAKIFLDGFQSAGRRAFVAALSPPRFRRRAFAAALSPPRFRRRARERAMTRAGSAPAACFCAEREKSRRAPLDAPCAALRAPRSVVLQEKPPASP